MFSRTILAALALGVLGVACVGNAPQGLESAADAQDLAAQTELNQAGLVAANYFAVNGDLSGFNAAQGGGLEPGLTWADGGDPTEGTISVRGAAPDSVVMVTMSAGGNVLCLGVTASATTMGKSDADTAADCSGGW